MYSRIKDKGRRKVRGREGGKTDGWIVGPTVFVCLGGGRGDRKGSKKGGWERDREGMKKAWKVGKEEGGKEREKEKNKWKQITKLTNG